jgi:hypothetical protein
MGILKKRGKNVLTGKVGNTVTYEQHKEVITRTIGDMPKRFSTAQLAARARAKLLSGFLDPVIDLLRVGFEKDKNRKKLNFQNLAFSANYHTAITGTYPDLKVDFANAVLTMGRMPATLDAIVSITETGVAFEWPAEWDSAGTHWNDQVIMIAYFPQLKQVKFIAGGAIRQMGRDELPVYGIAHGFIVETYISFISDNRKKIARSSYTGQLVW